MRTAVVRINPDPTGALSLGVILEVRAALRSRGITVVESDLAASLPRRRELELVLAGADVEAARLRGLELVRDGLAQAGVAGEPLAGAVTFTSAGTPADALGIFRAFGVLGEVRRAEAGDAESVVFVVGADAFESASQGRLLTALQSGLNQGVSLVTDWDGPSEPL